MNLLARFLFWLGLPVCPHCGSIEQVQECGFPEWNYRLWCRRCGLWSYEGEATH